MTGNWSRHALTLAFYSLLLAASHDIGCAQTAPSAKQREEADIREALGKIIAEDPAHAAQAQKVLDALAQPEGSAEGRQARNRRERGARRIVNGLPSRSHPAVGALLKGGTPQTAGLRCTGTLVGCDKFLTAAHCIAGDPAPRSYQVFFQEAGFFEVKAIQWAPEIYQEDKVPYFDLAMLTLARPVEGIAPMPINTSVKPLNNSIATIVGFGRTGGMRRDPGMKREGTVKLAACPGKYADASGLCWRFDADVIADASASNTCNADSGGGIFMRDDQGARVVEKLFGVVSGGDARDCMTNDLAFNVDVFKYRDWIATAGEGRLSSAMCGNPIGGGQISPMLETVSLTPGTPEISFTVEAPENASALRVAMNAEGNGKRQNQFEFSVFRSNHTDAPEKTCKYTGAGPFAFCVIEKPSSGSWTIVVKRTEGEGQAQITTLFVR